MAVEKGLVLTAIEAKLKGKSASKNFKENIAAKWAEKIENEDGIQAFIDDREDVLIEASAEADRRAVAAAKKAKEEAAKKVVGEEPDPKDDPNVPDYIKSLNKTIESLNSKIESFEAGNKAKTIAEKFLSHKDVKGVNLPESVKTKYVPQSEDDFESAVESFTTDFKPLVEANALSAYGNDKPTGSTDRKAVEPKKISAEDAKKVVESM